MCGTGMGLSREKMSYEWELTRKISIWKINSLNEERRSREFAGGNQEKRYCKILRVNFTAWCSAVKRSRLGLWAWGWGSQEGFWTGAVQKNPRSRL